MIIAFVILCTNVWYLYDMVEDANLVYNTYPLSMKKLDCDQPFGIAQGQLNFYKGLTPQFTSDLESSERLLTAEVNESNLELNQKSIATNCSSDLIPEAPHVWRLIRKCK